MFSSLGKRIVLLVAILALTACKQQFTIEAPSNNHIDNDQPELFHVTYPDGQPAGMRLFINAVDVTSSFTLGDIAATASGDDLAEYIFAGRNVFRATAGATSKQVYFTYDLEGPVIHILEASHSGASVRGYLTDAADIVALSLDGTAVTLDENNAFDTAFTSLPVNVFEARDSFGNRSETQFARNDQVFHPGISARLNAGGVSFLGDALEAALGNINFQDFLADINPLVSLNFIGFFSVNVELKNFSFDQPVIDLAVQDNERLDTHVEIPNFSIGLEMGGNTLFFIPWSVGGTISMDKLVLDTKVLLDIVNKDIDVDLNNTAVDMQGFHLDLDHIPNILGFEDLLSTIIGAIADALLPFFTGIIENVIVPVVSDFIGELNISLDITTAEGETLRVQALPEYLDSFDNGITIDLGATLTAPFPSEDARATLGHLYSEGGTPTIGNTTPDGEPFDIGASISINVINQALLAAHESGITTMQIRPETTPGTDPEGVSVIDGSEDIQQTDRLGMRLEPASPPFIKLMDREGTWGVLGWYDVKLAFDLRRVGWEDYQTLFVTTFNLEVPFELGATDDGFLQIGIEKLPTIQIIKSDEQGSLVLSPVFINGILQHFMPAILPTIAAELKAIPLPRIAGHSIHPEAFWVAGEGQNNLSLAGSLVKLSTTEAATAPDTLLDFSSNGSAAATAAAPLSTQSTELSVTNGTVNIGVSGSNPTGLPLEYRYRVDGGAWSVWKPRSNIQLQYLLGGDHRVEVCSRTVLMKQEVDCPSVSFTTSVN
ncbi:MAG: hypothetical protein MI976_18725 [Pseudomonadales bacterium]|nr:hypothetical protein [Pseudomonadales bacterium]